MIELFRPNIPDNVYVEVEKTLKSKYIAQGPKVREFEDKFKEKIVPDYYPIATNSTTGALHLAYIMSGISRGDEVITPVFTCTATTFPILWLGATPIFADIDFKLNINPATIESKITSKTKAIICMNYAGYPCEFDKLRDIADKYNLKLICDNAHGIKTYYNGKPIEYYCDYVVYSFQAIKFITTGDGGMIVCKTKEEADLLKKLRWFGINKEEKMDGTWDGQVDVIGYKYHMNDIAATIGLASLDVLDSTLERYHRQYKLYKEYIHDSGRFLVHTDIDYHGNVPWLCTLYTINAQKLQNKLETHGIECGKIHYRNDIYKVFGGKRQEDLVIMNGMENCYLVVPMCCTTTDEDIKYICNTINEVIDDCY